MRVFHSVHRRAPKQWQPPEKSIRGPPSRMPQEAVGSPRIGFSRVGCRQRFQKINSTTFLHVPRARPLSEVLSHFYFAHAMGRRLHLNLQMTAKIETTTCASATDLATYRYVDCTSLSLDLLHPRSLAILRQRKKSSACTVSAAKPLSGDVHSTNSATNGVVAAGEMP